MKQLHNQSLHTDINQLLNQFDTKLDQMNQLRNAIVELVSNQESFTGATGNSIRTYYQNIHLPFISFYCASLENYKSSLQKLRETSFNLEENKSGVIKQEFLEGELTDSLDRTKRKAIDLVDEANSTFSSISDIVHISHLNTDDFKSSIDEAKRATDETVEDLVNFDSNNSEGLESVGDDILMMEQYVAEMESMVKNGTLSLENYTPLQTNLSLAHSAIIQSLDSRINSSSTTYPYQFEPMKALYSSKTPWQNITTGQKGYAASAYKVSSDTKKGYNFEPNIKDGWSDGVGNASFLLNIDLDDKKGEIGGSASIVNTDFMDKGIESLKTKLLYGDFQADVPYAFNSISNSILYGQNIGGKIEAGVGKVEISHDNSPISGSFNFGQAEAKANYEDYTLSAGASASAVKLEIKVEPLNFFGYEPLEEWFGIEKDPYLGVDILLGSAGIGGSVGMETSIYAAYGIGVGGKAGLMPEDQE
ncbi:LXG domain-containing protein [Terribacillus saccharophilus]|uniref:LXG domain-containing protein n=1 Tax=Terribacillus saccharophilus TaxID=361277 RepID=A0ABX4GZI7_9BACI|nr:LXG domain-containing protein [Terribacillus saccharophilus]PAD36252.1 hypothetical protein CHH56_05495 [Terribacillus saccharophilus]PAD96726.1 hypothetical protein CHH50_06815 [Terribacillus saccharophilus]PAE00302.1 hypothetical protein CHH48_07720 [Terribacillus saccharophilus]